MNEHHTEGAGHDARLAAYAELAQAYDRAVRVPSYRVLGTYLETERRVAVPAVERHEGNLLHRSVLEQSLVMVPLGAGIMAGSTFFSRLSTSCDKKSSLLV
jgi:hypothetical protein